ncbi:rhodanese-like domain-containing protein [Agromyces atrinae]|uniref:Rhodanese-like domain-containing protein n=1 Tax=Agromyces atrinae TaxID=592376 RepID=A0A4Q2M2P7_9MICO|nr:rhodanese-like domain-containing protein [Agromyces atrinae]NYD65882.1 rhodanese-related sulfurtransferase [Agromyces atrinae]RXZ86224.1 rhodanese-like domain-containing protein [Agromyces atrinae]
MTHDAAPLSEPGADVSVAEANAAVEAGAVWLLDVREQSEWDAGHAVGAHHIPLGSLGARQDELPADADIFVVCHVGGRSRMAVDALVGAEYRAWNVAGGMVAWEAAGAPTTSARVDN